MNTIKTKSIMTTVAGTMLFLVITLYAPMSSAENCVDSTGKVVGSTDSSGRCPAGTSKATSSTKDDTKGTRDPSKPTR